MRVVITTLIHTHIEPRTASKHQKINLSISQCKDHEDLGVMKMINTAVKSIYQSSIPEECTVFRFVDSEIDSWKKRIE